MIELSAEEQRVLGVLLEKQYVTPDAYPLTMNGLITACNQATNRNPVVSYGEHTIHQALDSLREKGLLRIVYSQSNRATKYREVLQETRELARDEAAVICVLLLRGPQTIGELRSRTERIHPFESLGEVEQTLDRLAARPEAPFAVRMERQPGQKDVRYRHLLGEPFIDSDASVAAAAASASAPAAPDPGLADEVARLRADLDQLRQEFEDLRSQLM
jgi:uncharacterized protein